MAQPSTSGCEVNHGGIRRIVRSPGTNKNLDLTFQEKSLIRKVPPQWRGLLTLILNTTSVTRDRLMTLLAMRCRRQVTHSIESWDTLLTAMSKRIPVVASDGTLCFHSLLWCFPDSFVQDFLKFLLRFHSIISPDSLDRFLNLPVPESFVPSVVPLFQELTSALAKRSGALLDDETAHEKNEKTSARPLVLNSMERCARRDSTEHSAAFFDIAVCAENDQGKSNLDQGKNGHTVPLSDNNSKYKTAPEIIQNITSNKLGKEMLVCDKFTASPTSSEKLILPFNPAVHLDLKDNDDELGSVKAKHLTADAIQKSDSFVLVLDSSDEEDVLRNEKMEVDSQKGGRKAGETQHDNARGMDKECKKEGQCEPEGLREDGSYERQEGEGKATGMAEDAHHGQAVLTAEEDFSGNTAGFSAELRTHIQKLKETLTSGHRDAASSDFDFLLCVPAYQVSQCFAAVEWGNVGEESVCGLIQSVVGMSERLSHGVSAALVDSVVRPIYTEMKETPSRQLMSCLSDLATTYPHQLASVLCDCLHESLCSSVQSEMVTSLCKNWTTGTMLFFLRKLCRSDILLDDNLLSVAQCILGTQPFLSLDLLESVLRLLETGSTPLARNARYGRLVLNFVKSYKTQINPSHMPVLQSIVSVHSSVVRKSLQSAVNALPFQ